MVGGITEPAGQGFAEWFHLAAPAFLWLGTLNLPSIARPKSIYSLRPSPGANRAMRNAPLGLSAGAGDFRPLVGQAW